MFERVDRVFANPMLSLWDSDKRERERRRQNY
jgi:hypothetical protein